MKEEKQKSLLAPYSSQCYVHSFWTEYNFLVKYSIQHESENISQQIVWIAFRARIFWTYWMNIPNITDAANDEKYTITVDQLFMNQGVLNKRLYVYMRFEN